MNEPVGARQQVLRGINRPKRLGGMKALGELVNNEVAFRDRLVKGVIEGLSLVRERDDCEPA